MRAKIILKFECRPSMIKIEKEIDYQEGTQVNPSWFDEKCPLCGRLMERTSCNLSG